MLPALITISVLLGLALAACAWLFVERKRLVREQADATRDVEEFEAQRASLVDENHRLATEIAVLKEKQAGDEQRLNDFKQQLDHHLKALTGDALKESNKQFLTLADEKLKPIRELLSKYDAQYQRIEKSRNEQFGTIEQAANTLKDQTTSLVNALRRPEVRGRWGEVALQRIVELAGLTERCDFDTQTNVTTDEGRLRPDLVVNLPNERQVVVDSKVPLDAFLQVARLPEGPERDAKLADHVRQLKTKIQQLASKSYQSQFDRSPDFVVLFVPVESALYAALEVEGELLEEAMKNRVVIATPTLLIALLKAVEMGWREQRVAESAEQIRDLGEQLHERLAKALGDVASVGASLEGTVKKYNTLVGSLGSRVMPAARRFEQLGARSAKEMPAELPAVEVSARELPTINEGTDA